MKEFNKKFNRIFVTGDIHEDIRDLWERICRIPDVSKDDLLIILGDCGFFYYHFYGNVKKDFLMQQAAAELPIMAQFANNPEEFIISAAELIRDEIATVVIKHIKYHKLTECYDETLFTAPTIKGTLGKNAMKAERHLYDHVRYDSEVEREFAETLETRDKEVAVYIKLPSGFYISTPVGKYNPDWAIAFYEGAVKHIYFVAETKGSMKSMQLKGIEELKEDCAIEHFKAISDDTVKFKIISTYDDLLKLVKA